MPSFAQIVTSIWPRFDAAAVWTIALWPSIRIVSVKARLVSGLTKQEAPSAGSVPSGRAITICTGRQRYSAYISPPSSATVLPSSDCASGDPPAASTFPHPTFPLARASPQHTPLPRHHADGPHGVLAGPQSAGRR